MKKITVNGKDYKLYCQCDKFWEPQAWMSALVKDDEEVVNFCPPAAHFNEAEEEYCNECGYSKWIYISGKEYATWPEEDA